MASYWNDLINATIVLSKLRYLLFSFGSQIISKNKAYSLTPRSDNLVQIYNFSDESLLNEMTKELSTNIPVLNMESVQSVF